MLALLSASVLMLPGCGTYMVASTVTKTVTGAGSMVVGGTVGAVRLTGRAAGSVIGDEPEEEDG